MSKQTAVEWLVQQLTEVDNGCINKTYLHLNNTLSGIRLKEIINQAKEMEAEQTEQARREGYEFASNEAFKEIHKNYKPLQIK